MGILIWIASPDQVGLKRLILLSPAMAITGDVTLPPDRITFANHKSFPLAPAGTVPEFAAPMERVSATLYRVTAPDDPVLLHGNRLCEGRARPNP
jgi:hypothetical protein